MVGDHFLVRGYENGRHFATREKFYPTLFVPSNKERKYKTLDGDYVESIDPVTDQSGQSYGALWTRTC